MTDVLLFLASLVEVAAGFISLCAKHMPILVGSLALCMLVGGIILAFLHLTESPEQRYTRRLHQAASKFARERAREQRLLRSISNRRQ